MSYEKHEVRQKKRVTVDDLLKALFPVVMCCEDVNVMSQCSQFHSSVQGKPLRTTWNNCNTARQPLATRFCFKIRAILISSEILKEEFVRFWPYTAVTATRNDWAYQCQGQGDTAQSAAFSSSCRNLPSESSLWLHAAYSCNMPNVIPELKSTTMLHRSRYIHQTPDTVVRSAIASCNRNNPRAHAIRADTGENLLYTNVMDG